MKRDSVVIYRNFYEGLKGVGERSYKRIMNAVLAYALDGIEPKLNGLEYTVFLQAKTQIDANNRKFENGKQGGRPRNQNETKEEPNNNQNETKEEPNETKVEPSHANEKCEMRNVVVSKKESKNINIFKKTNCERACARESYDELMDDWELSKPVKDAFWRFIQACTLNGHKITNDKLDGIIAEMEIRQGLSDEDKIRALNDAVNGGYLDIKRG